MFSFLCRVCHPCSQMRAFGVWSVGRDRVTRALRVGTRALRVPGLPSRAERHERDRDSTMQGCNSRVSPLSSRDAPNSYGSEEGDEPSAGSNRAATQSIQYRMASPAAQAAREMFDSARSNPSRSSPTAVRQSSSPSLTRGKPTSAPSSRAASREHSAPWAPRPADPSQTFPRTAPRNRPTRPSSCAVGTTSSATPAIATRPSAKAAATCGSMSSALTTGRESTRRPWTRPDTTASR